MRNALTIRKLLNTDFPELYQKFICRYPLADVEYECMLSLAVYFINNDDDAIRRLGYRIIVEYCNQTKNYKPLYDIAINSGLYPISKFIEKHHVQDKDRNFYTEWNDAFMAQFENCGNLLSAQQHELNRFFATNIQESVSVVAPTSYGKSELIVEAVKEYTNRNICIITSTKALLAQTKRRIQQARVPGIDKIVVHPEMYNPQDTNCIAVLTQERLLRLLKKDSKLSFDCVVVDEAHELLEGNSRSSILATDLIVLKKRNPEIAVKFLTPFIVDPDSLEPRYATYNISSFQVNEYIKTERFYLCDVRTDKGVLFYDQYLDEFYPIQQETLLCEEEVVKKYAGGKNLVYLNRPSDIEEFALKLAASLPDIQSEAVIEACKHISDYLQPQYNLLTCLKKGIIYHHGSVPDSIRIYIENLYRTVPEVRYVITSSTLLSGVNLPAEKLFLLSNKRGRANLTPESFRNLIGRVCRFSEIFDDETGNLNRLEPEIYSVYGKYYDQRANCEKFIRNVAKNGLKLKDNIQNVLLANAVISPERQAELSSAAEFVENYENGTIESYTERYTTTDIGKSCVMNGVSEVDIFATEVQMQEYADTLIAKDVKIESVGQMMEVLNKLFISHLSEMEYTNLKRLMNQESQRFYGMLIDWRTKGKSYSEMISLFVSYWKSIYNINPEVLIFVGHWGDVDRDGTHRKNYTHIKGKSFSQIINLAIVRLKEEQDFIDNVLIKFVEVLNDIGLMESGFYYRLKYGTENENMVCLLKNGLSLSLANLLNEKYADDLEIDIQRSTVKYSDDLISHMEKENENQILIFEMMSNV